MDTEILRPSADTAQKELNASSGDDNYAMVNEAIADDDDSYVYRSSTVSFDRFDLYDLPAHSGSGTINSVTVHIRCRRTVESGYAYTKLKTEATVHTGDEETLSGSYANFSKQYVNNPTTTVAWTWAQIDALQIGVRLRQPGPFDISACRCTQVYVEVDYTPVVAAGRSFGFIIG